MPKADKSSVKPTVISFRITDKHQKMLDAILDRQPIGRVNSRNQLARKLVCDYLAGKCGYADLNDMIGYTESEP
jgi:hypothetical protein